MDSLLEDGLIVVENIYTHAETDAIAAGTTCTPGLGRADRTHELYKMLKPISTAKILP